MPTPEQERLAGIVRFIEQLSARQELLEKRLARLERNSPLVSSVAQPPKPGLETKVGLNILNCLGVVTLVLGIAFFFKWAVDNNWVGPAALVFVGVLASLAALGVADFLWRRRQQVFAQGVTGAGVAILYVSLYSAYGFYHLILQWFACLLLVLVTVLAFALSIRYDSTAIHAFGLGMSYLTPCLLTTGKDQRFVGISVAFLLLCGWNVWWPAVRPQTSSIWRNLFIGANGLVYYGLSCVLSGDQRSYEFPLAVLIAGLYFAVAAHSFRHLSKQLAWVEYFTAHVVLLWGLTIEITRLAERSTTPENALSVQTLSASILFALYAVVLISAGVWTRTAVNRIAGLILMALMIVKLYLVDVWQLGRIYRISAFVVLGMLLISTSFLYSRFRSIVESWWKDDRAHS